MAVGYCFGGKYALELAIEKEVEGAVLNHPSLLDIPRDFQRLLESGSTAFLLINSCETDHAFGPDRQVVADEALGEGKYIGGYKRNYYAGCSHGFSVRGDVVCLTCSSFSCITIERLLTHCPRVEQPCGEGGERTRFQRSRRFD